jgi:hypothetical protein
MRFDAFTVAVYHHLYPLALLLCVATGVLCYASGEPMLAVSNFITAAFGIRLDEHIRRRRFERAEYESSSGWARARVPAR